MAPNGMTIFSSEGEKNPAVATFDAWMNLNRPMIDALTEINERLIAQVSRANSEWFGFINRRLADDIATSKQLMECRTLPDVLSASADFLSRARHQYQREFEYFALLNRRIADDATRRFESGIAEIDLQLRH